MRMTMKVAMTITMPATTAELPDALFRVPDNTRPGHTIYDYAELLSSIPGFKNVNVIEYPLLNYGQELRITAYTHLSRIIANADNINDTLRSGKPSYSTGKPIRLNIFDADNPYLPPLPNNFPGIFELDDGHHRVAQALRNKHYWLDAVIHSEFNDEPYETPYYQFPAL